MKHIHLASCDSTQTYLKELISSGVAGDYLVSCDVQENGIGQRSNTWDSYKNSLCFSFTAKENEILNLTSLEMGVLICSFFKTTFNTNLKLKWPNDIMNTEGEKVGGIIINKSGDQMPIVGIGLNIAGDNGEINKDYDIKAGFIFKSFNHYSKEDLSHLIFNFIHTHRLKAQSTVEKWNSYCMHLNQSVTIIDDDKVQGTFIGIGEYGQAIIKNKINTLEFYNGSLRIHH